MSGEVTDYKPREFGSGKNGGLKEFKAKSFETHPEQAVTKVAEKEESRFKLDHHVASQLGIEARHQQEFDEKVRKEIERRWQATKEKAEVEGYTKGLDEGKKEAFQAEKPRIEEKLGKLDKFLLETDKLKETIFKANETFLMGLIAQVARMVVLKEVELDKEYLNRVVISLLNQLGTKEDLKIFVSEQDAVVIDGLKAAVEKEFGKLNNTSFERSTQVPVGGCKIETRFGVVDAAVQTQIDNVMRSLKT
jgi:flagellar assembly protein FliH